MGGNLAPAEAPIRAGLYVRVSTQAQAERWSLPAQRKILDDLAARRGWDAVLYDEGGASAETIDARPVMQRLLQDVKAGRVDVVAVVEMERLCRASDLRDWAAITTALRDADVRIITPERQYNLGTAEDDFEADLRGILSKREKRKLLERTRRGLNEAKDAGRYAGGTPPTGYRYDPASRKLVHDPDVVPLIRRVFESPLTAWKLHRELHAEGIDLSYETIRRMRANPAYIAKRPDTTGKLVPADWEPLVEEAVWKRWQGRTHRVMRRSSRTGEPRYLLSGIARCAACGGPVVGTPIRPAKDGTFLFAYRCYNRTRCVGGGGQMPGWRVDQAVLDAVAEYAGDPDVLKERFRKAIEAADDPHRRIRRQELTRKAADLDDRQARLLDAVETGALPEAAVRKRLRAIEAERRVVQNALETLDAAESIPSLPGVREILDLAAQLCDGNRAVQRDLLVRLALGVRLDMRERRVTVQWRMGSEARGSA